jgi:hypothetical protein
MKHIVLLFLFFIANLALGQKLDWIPFNWNGDSVSGRYIDKLYITIPVSIENLPHKFNMQFDLGAKTTMVYGKSFEPYAQMYPQVLNKIDTNLFFWMENGKNFMLKDINFSLGRVNFGKTNLGLFKDFGDAILVDSVFTNSEKHIGTIAPDLFQDKILIIDFPKKQICVVNELPIMYAKAKFQPYKIKDGRIKIPLTIEGKTEDLLFDTGSSLFALMTTEKRARAISNEKDIDSLKISSWGEYYYVYGKKIKEKIKFGQKKLSAALVFYDRLNKFDKFYDEEKIWGITGNAYFLKNTVIIDYKQRLFGVY